MHKDFTCVIFLAKCDKAFATFEIDYPKRGARWKATFLSRKNLNIWMVLFLVVGMVIGSGVFFKATPVAKYSGSFAFIFFAWLLGGVMSLCGALVAAEFSARYPHTGGLYVYLEKIYGNKISFLFGWMNTLIYTPAILSALSVLFADQVSSMLNANQMMHDILALSILTAIVIINFQTLQIQSFPS